jgi:hypothetical protein
LAGDAYKPIFRLRGNALYDFELDEGDTNTNTILQYVSRLCPASRSNLPTSYDSGTQPFWNSSSSSWRVANEHAAAKLKYPLNLCEIVFDNSSGDNNEK